ncbi:hypothetical protein [Kiloniella laminariae]|uniref:hypothetical protein n=1 Tax=Kiloniella laminariae TaxID=454162 RepID=UPI000360E884|nr:hypothetical protein [Kiloniella laminariae]
MQDNTEENPSSNKTRQTDVIFALRTVACPKLRPAPLPPRRAGRVELWQEASQAKMQQLERRALQTA